MSVPTNQFQFGNQTITTKVAMMVPRNGAGPMLVNVTDAMDERATPRTVSLMVAPTNESTKRASTSAALDPFAEVEV
jgi:hypothetical protein